MRPEILPAPDLLRRVEAGYPFERVAALVNPRMLYNKHLGLKKPIEALLAERDPKALKLEAQVRRAMELAADSVSLGAVFSFFTAEPAGDALVLRGGDGGSETFGFPRQRTGERLCLADFVAPPSASRKDSVAGFVCTAGGGVLEEAARLREKGDYVYSHLLNICAVCLAEALAEAVHADIRRLWPLPDGGRGSAPELLAQRYAGKRFSFGYAACPGMENQAALFRLLRPEEIGVSLTESFMMSPEASVSALVFHYEGAGYFEII